MKSKRPLSLSRLAILALSIALTLPACGAGGNEASRNNQSAIGALVGADMHGSDLGDHAMADKRRPWDRTDVQVFRPEPIPNLQFDYQLKERKAVDPTNGDFIIMRPGFRGGPGQFLFGDSEHGTIGDGGYTGDWYPDEHTSVTYINALTLRAQPGKRQSRSEYDAANIARMMAAASYAALGRDDRVNKLQRDLPPVKIVVIDTRREK